MAADSRKVVLAALAGNVAIAGCKFAAAILSHSTATLAEAVHSVADTGNQALLLVGMRLAMRPADERFPFGRASERYFWPFVVALLLFSLGGAFAIFDGIDHLLHPPHEPYALRLELRACWALSLVFEAISFAVAFGEFRKLTGGRSLEQTLLEARDPTIPLVLAEDSTAMAGLLLALLAVGLSQVTGQSFWDPRRQHRHRGAPLRGRARCSRGSRTGCSSARAPARRTRRACSSLRRGVDGVEST